MTDTGDSSISFGGSIQNSASGVMTLEGLNSVSGSITNAGTMTLGSATGGYLQGGITNSGTLTLDGSAIQVNGLTNTATGTLNLSGSTEVGGGGGSGTLAGTITGSGGLILSSGTETLETTYTGSGIILSGGTLDLAQTGRIIGDLDSTGGSGPILDGGSISGTLDNPGSFTVTANGGSIGSLSGNFDGTLSGTLVLTNASGTAGGLISGSGTLVMAAGTQTVDGAIETSGSTIVDSGATLATDNIYIQNGLTDNGSFVVSGGGAGSAVGSLSGYGDVTLNGSTSLLTILDANSTYAGTIGGAGGISIASGTQTLTGASTYTGGTTDDSAILVGTTASFGSGAITLANDDNAVPVLDIAQDVDGTLSNQIVGAGNVTKDGAGNVTLTGANAYSGSTTVDAGTLTIDGNQSAATGNTNVMSGATLAGAGTIGGAVTIGSGAVLSPGDASVNLGTLTIAGDLTLLSGSTQAFSLSQASGSDLIDVGGNLTLGGTLDVTLYAGMGVGDYLLYNYAGLLSGSEALDVIGLASGDTATLDTSTAGQVSLSIASGAPEVGTYWNGGAGSSAGGTIVGGSGTWQVGSPTWTISAGTTTAIWEMGSTAVFGGSAGTVTIDDGSQTGPGTDVSVAGMQFMNTDGGAYVLTGDPIQAASSTLTVQVGDTSGGASSATIASSLADQSVSGGTMLDKTGSGNLTLSGANTYSGGTTISAGSITIGNDGALGSGAVLMQAGTGLGFSATGLDVSNAIALDGDPTVNVASGTDTLSGVISDGSTPGDLVKTGDGTLILSSVNTYTGSTTISGGTLALSGAGGISDSAVVTDNAGFDISAASGPAAIVSLAGSGAVALGANTLILTNAADRFAGTISGAGGLVLSGGTETLGGENTYTGATTIAAAAGLDVSGSVAGAIQDNGALTLDGGVVSGTVTDSGTLTVTGNAGSAASLSGSGTAALSGTLTLTQADGTFSGALSGTGGLSIAGGAERLNGVSTYTGGTAIAADAGLDLTGQIAGPVENEGALLLDGGAVGGVVAGNGSLTVSSRGGTVGALTGNGGGTLDGTLVLSDASGAYGGALGGVGGITIVAGTQTLTGANTYTGETAIASGAGLVMSGSVAGTIANAGTLTVTGPGVAAASLSGSGATTLDATLTLTAAHDTYRGAASGAGGLSLAGGTETLTGQNLYTGNTTIAQGATLDLSGSIAGAATNAGTLVLDNGAIGGTLIGNGSLDVSGNGGSVGSLNGTGAVALSGLLTITKASGAFSGAIAGSGGLDIAGGVQALSGATTYSGATTIASGATLTLSGAADLKSSVGMLDNGVLDLTAATGGTTLSTIAGSGDVRLGSGGLALTAASGTLSGVISGSGGLSLLSGVETLSGDSTYTGGTTVASSASLAMSGASRGDIVNAGTLSLDGATVSGTVTNNGAVTVGVRGAAIGSLNGAGAGTLDGVLTLTRASGTYAGTLAGAGGLTLAAGSETLTGTNRYTGGTTIVAGATLTGWTDSLQGLLLNNGTVSFDQIGNSTYSGTLSGSGGTYALNGSGTMTVTGWNDETDLFAVNAGTLNVLGGLAGAVRVNDGGTLSGTGSVGTTTIAAGGMLSPGGAAIGTLTVAGNLTLDAGGTYLAQIASNGGSDLARVTGATTIQGGTLAVQETGAGWPGRTTYTLISSAAGVSGRFGAISGNSTGALALLSPVVSYTADDVKIGWRRNDVAMGDDLHASLRSALIEDASGVRATAIDRLRLAACDAGAPGGTMRVKSAAQRGAGNGASCDDTRAAVWMQGYGAWGHNDSGGSPSAMTHSTSGFLFGVDGMIGDRWRGGLFAGYGRSSFDATLAYGRSTNTTIGAYAGRHWNRLALRLGGSYSWNILSTDRNVSLPGYRDRLSSDYNGGTGQAFADLGYGLSLHVRNQAIAAEPFATLAYVNQGTGGYRETGGAAAVSGRGADANLGFTSFGIRASTQVKAGRILLTPNLTAGYQHAFGTLAPIQDETFEAGAPGFSVSGTPLSRDAAILSAGIKGKVTDRLSIGVSYTGEYGSSTVQNGIKGSMNWTF